MAPPGLEETPLGGGPEVIRPSSSSTPAARATAPSSPARSPSGLTVALDGSRRDLRQGIGHGTDEPGSSPDTPGKDHEPGGDHGGDCHDPEGDVPTNLVDHARR